MKAERIGVCSPEGAVLSFRAVLSLPTVELPESASRLRAEVRAFLAEARRDGAYEPRCDAWMTGHSPAFSRMLGARGWIGMTLPTRYGGGERSPLERFVVAEELLAAGAPVAAHWFADRQSAQQLLRHGSDEARDAILPRIARGECYFAIGMSEPDAGSDLAAVRTAAERVDGGWSVTGAKVWTSHAQHSHYMTALCRTAPREDRPHAGLSVLVIDLASPGVTVLPIEMVGGEPLNEVVFDGAFVPDAMVLGEIGGGWRLITAELSLERSGPERFLSTFPLVAELVRRARRTGDPRLRELVGSIVTSLSTFRAMSVGVAALLADGEDPVVAAALVKDAGTRFERALVEQVRLAVPGERDLDAADPLEAMLADILLSAPTFTLRGGTTEVLTGIVTRGLGIAR